MERQPAVRTATHTRLPVTKSIDIETTEVRRVSDVPLGLYILKDDGILLGRNSRFVKLSDLV